MTPDPFAVLRLPATYSLAASEIDRAYFARSAALHPDLASGRPEAAREMAELNQAKAVLSDPERRADALLRRLGGPRRDEHKSLPPMFLAEIMEIREQVEAALASPPAAREVERKKWEQWAGAERERASTEVGAMFEALDPSPAPGELKEIRTRLNAWRYIERLIEQLDPAYDPARADFEGS